MKNRFSFIFTLLCMLMCSIQANADEVQWTEVSTPKEFYDAVKANANVRLMNDIDLSCYNGGDNYCMFGTFTGKITGENANGTDYALTNSTKPLFADISNAEISHLIIKSFYIQNDMLHIYYSFFAIFSKNSIYSHVAVESSQMLIYDESKKINIGTLVAESEKDSFYECSTNSITEVYFFSSYTVDQTHVGGFAGYASESSFSFCINSALVSSSLGGIGGIVGYLHKGTIESCLNTGEITGSMQVGGIAGNISDGTIVTRCVNTGSLLHGTYNFDNCVGGIIGEVWSSNNKCYDCLNFGSFDQHLDNYIMWGHCNESNNLEYSGLAYYCKNGDKYVTNMDKADIADLFNGKYAFDHNFYQSIDNDSYYTSYPVPIPEAGKVFENVLCDGTVSYSNIYYNGGAHEPHEGADGRCTYCGRLVEDSIIISDAAGLIALATEVNKGVDFSKKTVTLSNDIDMSGIDFSPIGISKTYPFKGTFDGQGHRIKNLIMTASVTYTGLFGCVAGDSTVIKNVVIDKTSAFISTKNNGVAGLIGCVESNPGDVCNVTIQNCGNEAQVSTAKTNAAGILGGVYTNDSTQICIQNCYNTGRIEGLKECAAICGYARKNYSITNCYNSGAVIGAEDGNYFYRNSPEGRHYVANCYDRNGKQGDGVAKLESMHASLGILCYNLNNNSGDLSVWEQDLEHDSYPVFGDKGLCYSRSMSNQWGTIVLPFDVPISDSNPYRFYHIADVNDTLVTMEELSDTLAAGTPAIICMEEAAKDSTTNKYELSLAAGGNISTKISKTAPVKGLSLVGTYSYLDNLTKIYFIANNMFWYADDPISLDPFRAYLNCTSKLTKSLSIARKSAKPTGISSLSAGQAPAGSTAIYTLSGQRLTMPQKGINIINGKKVLVK